MDIPEATVVQDKVVDSHLRNEAGIVACAARAKSTTDLPQSQSEHGRYLVHK